MKAPERKSWDDLFFHGAKIERTVLKSAFFVVILLAIPLVFFSLFKKYNVCSLNSITYYLWPPNFGHAQELLTSNVSAFDACLFLNLNSIASLTFLLWLLWRIYFDFKWGAYKFEKSVFILSVVGPFVSYYAATAPFLQGNSPFDPSLDAPILKSIAIQIGFIALFYICIGEALVYFIRKFSGKLL